MNKKILVLLLLLPSLILATGKMAFSVGYALPNHPPETEHEREAIDKSGNGSLAEQLCLHLNYNFRLIRINNSIDIPVRLVAPATSILYLYSKR